MKSTAHPKRILTAKRIAYIAVMTALLIGGQVTLGFVAGVEIVTVLLCSFSFVFGPVTGVLTAIAFSLLRCFIWGFYPTVIILYLIYYPLLAFTFGLLGKCTFTHSWLYVVLTHVILCGLAGTCIVCGLTDLIAVSRLYQTMARTLFWLIAGLCLALCIILDGLLLARKKSPVVEQLFFLTAIAALFTVCFTLLDDVITPLFFGYGKEAALGYFYTSFTALLPQTTCTILTMVTLFLPLLSIMRKAKSL